MALGQLKARNMLDKYCGRSFKNNIFLSLRFVLAFGAFLHIFELIFMELVAVFSCVCPDCEALSIRPKLERRDLSTDINININNNNDSSGQ